MFRIVESAFITPSSLLSSRPSYRLSFHPSCRPFCPLLDLHLSFPPQGSAVVTNHLLGLADFLEVLLALLVLLEGLGLEELEEVEEASDMGMVKDTLRDVGVKDYVDEGVGEDP